MAAKNAQIASELPKKKIFGKRKEADLIIYRLVDLNPPARENDPNTRPDVPKYPPYKRFPNVDVIAWTYNKGKEDEYVGSRQIRFLPGVSSIFVDEQEAGGRVIPQNVLDNPNNRFEVVDGDIQVRPHERQKIQFLDWCNRNADTPYGTGIALPWKFRRYSENNAIEDLSAQQEDQKDAFDKAFSATEEQIMAQVKYLGIPTEDPVTQASRDFEAIRTDYRQMAITNPKAFVKVFDDQDLKDKFYIEKAIEDKIIGLDVIPGKAAWIETREEICEIPPGVTAVEALFNFSQRSKAGEAMLKRLRES